jgi:hypothetical protein
MGSLLKLEEKECRVPNGLVFGGNLRFTMPLPFDIRWTQRRITASIQGARGGMRRCSGEVALRGGRRRGQQRGLTGSGGAQWPRSMALGGAGGGKSVVGCGGEVALVNPQ